MTDDTNKFHQRIFIIVKRKKTYNGKMLKQLFKMYTYISRNKEIIKQQYRYYMYKCFLFFSNIAKL